MRRAVALLLMGSLTIGCFSSQPIVSNPLPAGTQVVLQLTDAGRVAMSDAIGPSVDAVEGRLVSRDSAEWTLAVSMLQMLRGGQQVWSGERLTIRSEHVAVASERRFSRSRTAIVSAVVAGVIIAAVKGGLAAGNPHGDDTKIPPDSAATTRIPRPGSFSPTSGFPSTESPCAAFCVSRCWRPRQSPR